MTATGKRSYVPALRFRALTGRPGGPGDHPRERLQEEAGEGLDVSPGQQVLDLACGTGTLAVMIAEAYPQAGVTGLDGDPEVPTAARRRRRRHAHRLRGVSTELPYGTSVRPRHRDALLPPPHHQGQGAHARRGPPRPAAGRRAHVADQSDPVMRALFLPVRLLDGFEVTRVNAEGELPRMLSGGPRRHDRARPPGTGLARSRSGAPGSPRLAPPAAPNEEGLALGTPEPSSDVEPLPDPRPLPSASLPAARRVSPSTSISGRVCAGSPRLGRSLRVERALAMVSLRRT